MKTYKGDKGTAAWFPDRETAYVWRAWESNDSPLKLEAATADGTSKLPPGSPSQGRNMMANPTDTIALSATVKEGTAVKAVRFYDGDRLLGEAAAAPWTFSWGRPPSGVHVVWAEWTDPAGQIKVINPGLIAVRFGPAPAAGPR